MILVVSLFFIVASVVVVVLLLLLRLMESIVVKADGNAVRGSDCALAAARIRFSCFFLDVPLLV